MLYQDYVNRAKELGQQVLSSVEHGFQGNYMRCWQAAKAAGLKFVYGAEAYWVPDRHQPDRSNRHIVLLAKTKKGMYQLNRALSCASEDGYYVVPRVDMELLRQLDPRDVMVTTACVAYWGKVDRETNLLLPFEDHELLLEDMALHFGNSLFLEVQAHHTPWQKEVNQRCIHHARSLGVPLIAGLDSHYIYPDQRLERQFLREESGIKFAEGDHELDVSVFEDYPDEETAHLRFTQQGVLTESEIADAIKMTDIILDFEDIDFDTSRKFPTIYPDLTQEERNQLYLKHIDDAWQKYKQNVDPALWPVYEAGIQEETNVITSTNTSDYFLMDEAIFKLGRVKYGGIVTPTGRGSNGSYFTNTLLGLSTLDRFALPVTLYPSRFVTAERLRTGIPDEDMNVADPEPFIKAQEELLGEGHAYPFIAWGTLKVKSAFRLFARANNLPMDVQNEVVVQIEQYEKAKKHADEDEEILLEDYVDDKYLKYIDGSKPYKGIIVSASQAPCGFLLYSGDIRSEVGIIRVASESSGSSVLCSVIDGYTADEFGFVKNDILTVKVLTVNHDAMERAGLPQYTSTEMMELIDGDKPTWSIFHKGYTLGINQCEQQGAREKLMHYKPTCLKDLSAFVAAIRPGFKSMAGKFFNREKFNYGVPAFDALLQNDSTGSSWLLYQEDIMKCLSLAGFPLEETYPIIKAISKKKVSVIESAKNRFLEGFTKYLVETENIQRDLAESNAQRVWQVIIDASSYSFNASHSVAVSLDALYGAYLKAHYPYAYYPALLSMLEKKKDKDRIALVKAEMKTAFGINVAPCRFGRDNRDYDVDQEAHTISDSLTSIKFMSRQAAEDLYQAGQLHWSTFTDLLHHLANNTCLDSRKIDVLIQLGYFSLFGSRKKLMAVTQNYREGKYKITKVLKDATKEKRLAVLRELEKEIPDEDLTDAEILSNEIAYIGLPISTFPDNKSLFGILDMYPSSSPRLRLYNAATGSVGTMKVRKALYTKQPINKGDVIHMRDWQKKPAYTFANGASQKIPGVFDLWLTEYEILHTAA